ncbi:DUF4913 domain-containing protein [Yinghuangia sp. ASG 101]|uniref:DUF4913 domain-containing protein n=1 Tax=Yinghuangia sp. ASG 101 TaxID=2896848 RepID=UPI001E2ADBD8|nr:DUF4913 domain-containing protein [Yinghuangia sp. ASG 101]UGQ11391.1 DUF4913 domain-containing protein [Yinghuangia sp. ASG 101]
MESHEHDASFDEREPEPEPELAFRSVDEFVTDYLAQVVRRRLNRSVAVWCPSWWRHPEALVRLAALWRAFESLRLDNDFGISLWWLNHADPHLAALMDPERGPFAACDPRNGHNDSALEPLPLVPPPPELLHIPAFSLDAALREQMEASSRPPASSSPLSGVVDDGFDLPSGPDRST